MRVAMAGSFQIDSIAMASSDGRVTVGWVDNWKSMRVWAWAYERNNRALATWEE